MGANSWVKRNLIDTNPTHSPSLTPLPPPLPSISRLSQHDVSVSSYLGELHTGQREILVQREKWRIMIPPNYCKAMKNQKCALRLIKFKFRQYINKYVSNGLISYLMSQLPIFDPLCKVQLFDSILQILTSSYQSLFKFKTKLTGDLSTLNYVT